MVRNQRSNCPVPVIVSVVPPPSGWAAAGAMLSSSKLLPSAMTWSNEPSQPPLPGEVTAPVNSSPAEVEYMSCVLRPVPVIV